MNTWKKLDLRYKFYRPEENRLTALCLLDRESQRVEYRIGCFCKKRGSAKLWWEDSHGVDDPSSLRSRYEIQWSCIEPYRR